MKMRSLQLAVMLLPLAAGAQDDTARAAYTLGHRLAEEGHYAQAAAELRKVPQGDELHPYAARALLYSAWHSGLAQLFVETAESLLDCPDAEVARLAAASLAEYQLCVLEEADSTGMTALHKIAAKDASLQPTIALLEAQQMLLRGQLDAADAACRQIDANRDFPLEVRHRARLILADVLYAREEQAKTADAAEQPVGKPQAKPAAAAAIDDDDDAPAADEPETLQTLEGKGEETLLAFITANPDSPLLGEAFRRLKAHQAFQTSEYARTRLNDWINDPERHPRRATLALLVLQHLLNRDDTPDAPLDTTCADTAATAYPQEPATGIILLEQIRSLYLRGRMDEARRLLPSLPSTLPGARANAHAALWRAMLAEDNADEAWRKLLEETASTGGSLPRLVRRNAYIHALEHDANAQPDPAAPAVEQARMHLLSAQRMLCSPLFSDLARTERELRALLDSPQVDAQTAFRARLLLCEVDTARGQGEEALRQVQALREEASTLPAELRLEYYRTLEHAYRAAKSRKETPECIIAELRDALADDNMPAELADPLRLHLASLMTVSRHHREEAMALLRRIVADHPRGDHEPLALMLLAECTAQGHAPSALRDAIALHERAAAHADKATAQHARIRRASYLVRLGNLQQAADDMRRILNEESPAPREDALARMVLANALSTGDDSARAEALSCMQELVDGRLSELPREWQFMVLLAHGMRCSRMGETLPAIAAFKRIIAMNPALHTRKADDEEWLYLYRAATGAILLMLEDGSYDEALELTERVAKWNAGHASPKWARAFMQWADEIRQEHIHASRKEGK
ncbi:MAG: hypothetical protein Q3986_09155 [Akkermansia sp.]|nr:hypothetical protein [Akkermansia sp.]